LLNRRKKRLFDIALSLLFIVIFPVLILVVKNGTGMFRNIFSVLLGINSWVGYFRSTGGNHPGLPRIKSGIMTPLDGSPVSLKEEGLTEKLNLNYAKDYRIINDLNIVIKSVRELGRRPSQPDRQI